MKKFLLTAMLVCLLSPSLSLNAAREFKQGDVVPGAPSIGRVKVEKPNNSEFFIQPKLVQETKMVKNASESEEQLFEVKCLFKYDPECYIPSTAGAYKEEKNYTEYFDWTDNYVYLYVVPGLYDVIATFYKISNNATFGEMGKAYLILEDIEINGDMEIELDTSLITETISFETYNPDGEKSALRYIRYLNENYDWEIISEGNVYDYYYGNYVINKDYHSFAMYGNTKGVDVEAGPCGEWKSEWRSNVYINPVSDKYQIAQLRLLYNENECWVVPLFANGSRTQTVTNIKDKYSDVYDVKFENTPAGKECDVVSDEPYGMRWGMSWENDDMLVLPSLCVGLHGDLASIHSFRFCQTVSSEFHPEYHYFMNFSKEDSVEKVVDNYYDDDGNLIYEDESYIVNTIRTPMFVLGLESCDLYPEVNNRLLLLEEGGVKTDVFLKPSLSFSNPSNMLPVFGSTPQFMQFYYQTYKSQWEGYAYPILSYQSCGYYGDYRDFLEGEIHISVNGNVVANSPEELWQWQMECVESQMQTGKLVFDYLNKNIEIDGLEGKNSAKVCIDNSVENFTMPLIQSVQLRDGANHVTDSFSDTSEGKLLIAGGDFREMKGEPINGYGEIPVWYDVEACDLTVEYAPYGSNDFAPIEMNIEGNLIHGFGYPYVGSLTSVDKESATGWFDLRILMTDAAGNTQEQIISPAFKIDRLTGVQQESVNKANLRVIGKEIVADNGYEVEVYTLSGQRVENRNLPAGLYIARSADSVAKLMVK